MAEMCWEVGGRVSLLWNMRGDGQGVKDVGQFVVGV